MLNKPMKVAMKELPCILTLLLILSGCGLFGTEKEETNARISVEGVDGVRFGDTLAEVRRKLGPPTTVGYIDGSFRSWYHNYYQSGPHAGLRIAFFVGFGEPDSLIPADLFAVLPPFQGKTAEGIGIGSTTEELRNAWGEPELLRVPNDTLMYYCMGTRDATIVIEEDTVAFFYFGYNEPLEGWYTQCSE